MGYNALQRMSELNLSLYGIEDTVYIPELTQTKRDYGKEALSFIRDNCEDLKLDAARSGLADSDGRSAGKAQIPYNMEKDLDRLS